MKNSKIFKLKSQCHYEFNITIRGIVGRPYSSFVTVILLDKQEKEKKRYIKWINDFSGNPKEYTICFFNKNTPNALIGYRANTEGPIKSKLEFDIPEISSLQLLPSSKTNENFDRYEAPPPDIVFTENEKKVLEEKLVWIFGSPRSGSTWLCTQLLNHKFTTIWNEPYIGFNLAQIRSHGMSQKHWHEWNGYFFSQKYMNNCWIPALRNFLLFQAYCQNYNLEDYIVIKEPNGSNGADIIMQALPNSKIIFLVRDGRDVVDSQIDAHKKNSWNEWLLPFENQQQKEQAIKNYSKMWKNYTAITMKAYENHNSHLRLLVKYENLRKDTITELSKIYQFVGIEITNDELQKIVETYRFENLPNEKKGSGKFSRSATPGLWKKNFTIHEQQIITSIMFDELKKFGYLI